MAGEKRFVIAGLIGLGICNLYLLTHVGPLEVENERLRNRLTKIEDDLRIAADSVAQVKKLDKSLRQISYGKSWPLAMGPVGEVKRLELDRHDKRVAKLRADLLGEDGLERELDLLEGRVELLDADAKETAGKASALFDVLEEQQRRMASTPTLSPAKGSRTSSFGLRTDPYTGLEQMHAGIDISANVGEKVIATGNAIVLHAGPKGAFGQAVILDHGQGLTTVYAHLSTIRVRAGTEVKRGEVIGAVGNTGRSTGPHVHYEVRLNGIPKNPEAFILD